MACSSLRVLLQDLGASPGAAQRPPGAAPELAWSDAALPEWALKGDDGLVPPQAALELRARGSR